MSLEEITGYAPVLATIIAAVLLVWAAFKVARYIRADVPTRRSIRQAARIRRGWQRLAKMCGLSVTDKTPTLMQSLSTNNDKKPEPRVLVPKITTQADAFGVLVSATCLPKVGLEEFKRAIPYLANAWKCARVSVTPAGPGRLLIRAVREDPLIAFTHHVPTGEVPKELSTWIIGVDEYAEAVEITLANVPGVVIVGLPGYGKTSFMAKLICDFAPSPAFQVAVADGKASKVEDGDYAEVSDRLFAYVGDDLADANKLFKRMVQLRRDRMAAIRDVLGEKNMWKVGPSPTGR
ncbi:hypothetical protein T261_3968 [Streptomyces lydicus]|nr:hypothetical protein T261_3968 [Streptomyces lydicus]